MVRTNSSTTTTRGNACALFTTFDFVKENTSHSPPGRGEGQMQEGEGRKEVQADAKGTLSLCLVSLLYGGGF